MVASLIILLTSCFCLTLSFGILNLYDNFNIKENLLKRFMPRYKSIKTKILKGNSFDYVLFFLLAFEMF